jgi:DNA replication protein DnaC
VITEQTIEKMRKMRMNHMAVMLKDILDDPHADDMSFAEGMALLVDHEWDYRHNHKSETLTNKAGFTEQGACIESIDYSPERGLDRQKMLRLASCDYIKARQGVLLLGKTGVGKSFVAQALGNAACRHHKPTLYIRMSAMFDDLAVAASSGCLAKAMDAYIKPLLLVVDDCFLTQPKTTDIDRFLELVEKRMHSGSTIFCSQLSPDEWHGRIEEKIVADAILDRIVSRSHIIKIQGDSMRKRDAVAE